MGYDGDPGTDANDGRQRPEDQDPNGQQGGQQNTDNSDKNTREGGGGAPADNGAASGSSGGYDGGGGGGDTTDSGYSSPDATTSAGVSYDTPPEEEPRNDRRGSGYDFAANYGQAPDDGQGAAPSTDVGPVDAPAPQPQADFTADYGQAPGDTDSGASAPAPASDFTADYGQSSDDGQGAAPSTDVGPTDAPAPRSQADFTADYGQTAPVSDGQTTSGGESYDTPPADFTAQYGELPGPASSGDNSATQATFDARAQAVPVDSGAQDAQQAVGSPPDDLTQRADALAADQGNLQQAWQQAGVNTPDWINPAGTAYDVALAAQAGVAAQQQRALAQQQGDVLNQAGPQVSARDALGAPTTDDPAAWEKFYNDQFQQHYGHPFGQDPNDPTGVYDQQRMGVLQDTLNQQVLDSTQMPFPISPGEYITYASLAAAPFTGGLSLAGRAALGAADAGLRYGTSVAGGASPTDPGTIGGSLLGGTLDTVGAGAIGGAAENGIRSVVNLGGKKLAEAAFLGELPGQSNNATPVNLPNNAQLPGVLASPSGAVIDTLRSDPIAIANGVIASIPTSWDDLATLAKSPFTQTPETAARQAAYTRILTGTDPLIGSGAGRIAQAAVTLADLAVRNLGAARAGDPLPGFDPFGQYDTIYQQGVQSGLTPAQASAAAADKTTLGIANAVFALNPRNPLYDGIELPGVAKWADMTLSNAAMKSRVAENAILTTGRLLDAATNPAAAVKDFLTGLSKESQARIGTNAIDTALQTTLPVGDALNARRGFGAIIQGSQALADGNTALATTYATNLAAEFGGLSPADAAARGVSGTQTYLNIMQRVADGAELTAQAARTRATDLVAQVGWNGDRTAANTAAYAAGANSSASDVLARLGQQVDGYFAPQTLADRQALQVVQRQVNNLNPDVQAYFGAKDALTGMANRGIRAALDLPTITDPTALNRIGQIAMSALRTGFLLPVAPDLAIRKLVDEYFRATGAGQYGINLADTTIAGAIGRNLAQRGSGALSAAGNRILGASSVSKLIDQGGVVPSSLYRSTREMNPAGKFIDSMVGDTTRHQVRAVNYAGQQRVLSGSAGERATLADDIRAIAAQAGAAGDGQQIAQRIASLPDSAKYRDYQQIANDVRGAARAPSFTGQSRMTPVGDTTLYDALQAPHLSNEQVAAITRQRVGDITADRQTQLAANQRPAGATSGNGVPQNYEEYVAWRDAQQAPARAATPAAAEPASPPVATPRAVPPPERAPLGTPRAVPAPERVPLGSPRPVGAPERAPLDAPAPVGRPGGEVPQPRGGTATTVRFENGESYPAQYRVVSLDDLQLNHPDVQPRNRAQSAVSEMQVQRMATSFDPARVLNDVQAIGEGPPVVTADGKILSGNGRASALTAVRDRNPAAWQAYQDRLMQDAGRYGITPEQLAGVKDPVLVRENLHDFASPAEMRRYAENANAATTLGRNTTELARNDLALMNDHVMSAFRPERTNGLGAAVRNSEEAVTRFVREIQRADPSAAASLVADNGALRNAAFDRFENALVARAYGEQGPALATRVLESPDADFKTIGNAIRDAAPQVARAGADIGGEIRWALDSLPTVKREGLEKFLGNGTLFADPARTPEAEQMLRFLWENRGSQTALTKGLRDYVNLTAPEGGSVGLLGNMATSKGEALSQITAAASRGKGAQPGLDWAAGGFGDGGSGYLSSQQRSVRDQGFTRGEFGIDRARAYEGTGTRAPSARDAQIRPYRNELTAALGTAPHTRGTLDDLLERITGQGLTSQELGHYGSAVNTEIGYADRFLKNNANPVFQAKAAHDLAEMERFANGLAEYRASIDPAYAARSSRLNNERFGPDVVSAPQATPPAFNPVQRGGFTPVPERPPTQVFGRDLPRFGTADAAAPRTLNWPESPWREQVAQRIEQAGNARTQSLLDASDAGSAAVARTILEQPALHTPIGEKVLNGLFPFAEFHLNASRINLTNYLEHPLMLASINHYLDANQDEYGTVPVVGNVRGNVERFVTGADELSKVKEIAGYARDAWNDPTNSYAQKAGKIAGYATVGNGAYVGPWAPYQQFGENLLSRTTNPLYAGVDKQGNPVVDRRDLITPRNDNYVTGALRLGADNIPWPNVNAGPVNLSAQDLRLGARNAAGPIGNPGGYVSDRVIGAASRAASSGLLGAAGLPPENDAYYAGAKDPLRALPYFAGTYAETQHLDPKAVRAAMDDIATTHGNPTTPLGQRLLLDYQKQIDGTLAAKADPLKLYEPPAPGGAKPIFGYDQTSPAEIAYKQRIDDSRLARDQHYDAQTAVGREFNFSDASRDARAIAQLHGTYSPEAIAAADQARNLGKAYGTQGDIGRGGRPLTEHQIAQGQIQQNANAVASDITTGRIYSPEDRQTYLQAKQSGEAPTHLGAGAPISVTQLLGQPGNYYDTLNKAEAAQRAGQTDQAQRLFAAADAMKNQTPETARYFELTGSTAYRGLEVQRDQAIRANADALAPDKFAPTARTSASAARDAAYFGQLSPAERQAYDQYQQLEASATARQYNDLTRQLYDAGGPTSQAGKAFLANHPEYAGLQQQYEAALHGIHDVTGVNPREVSNTLKGAAGETNLTNLSKDNAYYGLDPNSRQAYDAYRDLSSSAVAQRYFDLEAAAPKKGEPGYTEWWRANGAAYTEARNAYNQALTDIQTRTGVNPRDANNRIRQAEGLPPTATTDIPAQSAGYSASNGTGGTYTGKSSSTAYPSRSSGTSTRTTSARTTAARTTTTRTTSSGRTSSYSSTTRGGGGTNATAASPGRSQAASDFYGAYGQLTAAEKASARANPEIQRVLADSRNATAADYANAARALGQSQQSADAKTQSANDFFRSFSGLTSQEKAAARANPAVQQVLANSRTATAQDYQQASKALAQGTPQRAPTGYSNPGRTLPNPLPAARQSTQPPARALDFTQPYGVSRQPGAYAGANGANGAKLPGTGPLVYTSIAAVPAGLSLREMARIEYPNGVKMFETGSGGAHGPGAQHGARTAAAGPNEEGGQLSRDGLTFLWQHKMGYAFPNSVAPYPALGTNGEPPLQDHVKRGGTGAPSGKRTA